MLRVADGIFARMPFSSGVSSTWQPSLELQDRQYTLLMATRPTHVSSSPNARSSMSFSSSSASGSLSKISGSRMTWHVEHATERSHAPDVQRQQTRPAPLQPLAALPTLKVHVVLVRKRQQVVALLALDGLDLVAL